MNIFYEGQVLWSQIDANRHMRHSAYADFAAQARLSMFDKQGLSLASLYDHNIGPLLFREELVYLREVGVNDHIKVTCELVKARPDGSRWTIRHEMYRGDGVKAAVITVDGAWIDIQKRKLAIPPQELAEIFMTTPRSADFVEDTSAKG